MSEANFQDGVGKKIVEALKQQDDDLDVASNTNDEHTFATEQNFDYGSAPLKSSDFSSNYNVSEMNDSFNNDFEANQFTYSQDDSFSETPSFNYQSAPQYTENVGQIAQQAASSATGQHMPPNVAVLRRLISQLPNGVTKQTGAQIIRQTMEALGISMNNVLHEAQQVQDTLNDSVKTCMYTIQEYKNNIKTLEKQVIDYQKQIAHLNDLISLFVMTDKSR